MGAITFTAAQQQQFAVNESGDVLDEDKHKAALEALKAPVLLVPEPAPVIGGAPPVMICGGGPMICGGKALPNEGGPEFLEKIRHLAEERAAKEGLIKGQFESFKGVQYRTQVVAGTNYFCKVMTGPEQYIHLTIFEGLGGAPSEITEMSGFKKLDDEL